MVVAYGPVRRNVMHGNQPTVKVYCRRVHGSTLGGILVVETGITTLGALRIGSVWEEGQLTGNRAFSTRYFTVDFADFELVTPWRRTADQAERAYLSGTVDHFFAANHPLPDQGDDWYLRFPVLGADISTYRAWKSSRDAMDGQLRSSAS